MTIRAMIATAVLVLTTAARMPVAGGAADAPAAPVTDETVYPLSLHTASSLKMEPVGQMSVKAWYRELEAGRASDQSPWKQLVWFKKNPRTAQKSYFVVVDFEKGTIKELPTMVPSLEPWASRWVNGKYYVGMNLPARLAVFDPATETFTPRGRAMTCTAHMATA